MTVSIRKEALVALDAKLMKAKTELNGALSSLLAANERLTRAIEATEMSRQGLHEAGRECWIDRLDHENGGAKG